MASEAADRAFWPPIARIFDFTLKFEESIFSIAPSGLAILVIACMVFYYLRKPTVVRKGLLLWLKLAAGGALIAMQIASLAIRSSKSEFRTSTSIPALALNLVAALALALVLFVEHCRALRESAFLGMYLSATFLLSIATCRSYFMRPGLEALGGLAAADAVLRLIIALLEEVSKNSLIIDDELRRISHGESIAGFWTRSLFMWLNPMIWKGYKDVISIEDIGEIGPEFSSSRLFNGFHPVWLSQDKTASLALAKALLRRTWVYVLFCFLARLAFTGCSFALPFILVRMTDVITKGGGPNEERVEDSLIGATVLTLVGLAISRGAFQQMGNRLSTRVRGILVTEILDKCQHISQAEATKSAALTLMSTDMETIATDIGMIYRVPVSIIEVGLSTYFLSFFVGQGCFVVLFPLAFSTLFGIWLGSKSGPALAAWNGKVQIRVAETQQVLSQLRVIKMLGLGPTVTTYLQGLREIEIDFSKKYRVYTAILMGSAIFTALLPSLLIVAVGLFWTNFGGSTTRGTLPVNNIFPTLSIVALSQNPLSDLLKAYVSFSTLFACLGRVEKYLCLPESVDPRQTGKALPDGSDSDGFTNEKSLGQSGSAIKFSNADIAPVGGEEPVLRNVDLSIPRSSVTATVGASGSGKSTLLQSIIGEAKLLRGSIAVEEEAIGFADQTAWIRNMSIRDNIVAYTAYDEERYQRVIHACMLQDDLDHLPGGDSYVAGSNGGNLSGGQRNRIAAARAAYSEAKLVVLDDIFSALDRKTAVTALFRLCGPDGILRKAGATVILCTYLPECLDVADQTILLDDKGGVTLESNAQDSALRSRVRELGTQMGATSEKVELDMTPIKRKAETNKSEMELLKGRRRQDMSLYTMFINSIGKRYFWPWILVAICVPLGESMIGVYMRVWVTNAASNALYYIGYVGIATAGTIASASTSLLLFRQLAPRTAAGLHEKLAQTVMHSKISYFSSADSGFIINRFSQDMNLVSQVLPFAFSTFVYMLFHILIQFGIILAGATYSTAMLPFMFVFIWFLQYFYLRTSRQMRHLDLELKTPLYGHFSETASGLRHIRAFGWKGANFNRSVYILDESQKPYYGMSSIQRWLGFYLDMFACAIGTTVAAFALKFPHTTSAPALGLSFLNLVWFGLALGFFIQAWVSLETSVGALSRLREFLDDTPVERDVTPTDLPPNWPNAGHVEFKNVTAQYSEDAPQAIKDVSFTVNPGTKVGITGRTGSGKTSMFLSLLGFLEYRGAIVIDGVDISKIPLDELRSRIVTVSQENLDIGGTIRNSLVPFELNHKDGDSAEDDSEIESVLERLNIWGPISKQGGLDAKLDKVGLSHGQLQLFSIARAILRQKQTGSKLVLMDEATSHVDMRSDSNAQKFFRETFDGCTILAIAHRLETIEDADMFVDLAHGVATLVEKK